MRKNITVIAEMRSDGNVVPLEIIWEGKRKILIDRVLDKRKAASTRGGGMGIRYSIRIGNNQRYLFLDEYLWFVEI